METPKKRFDWDRVLSEGLAYAQHGRLILLLLCAGCLAGVCYYVYATPMYSSVSVLKVRMFNLPVTSETDGEVATSNLYFKRLLVERFRTEQFTKLVAVDKGWATEEASAPAVRQFIVPVVRFQWLDAESLQITVMSTFPEVVREYASGLAEIYQKTENDRRVTYREQGISRYIAELDDLKKQMSNEMTKRFDFEKDRNMTDLFIAQKNLTQVPRGLILAKSRIEQLDRGFEKLEENRKNGADIVALLSLLTNLEEEALNMDDIGEFVRKQKGDSPLVDVYSKAVSTEVVMAPKNMEDWRNWERERRVLSDDLKAKSKIYLPEHSIIKDLTAKLGLLEQKLLGEYEGRLSQLQSERMDLEQRQKDLQAKIPDYQKVTKDYEEFRLDYDLLTKSELAWDKMFGDLAKKVAGLQYGAEKDRVDISFDGFVTRRDRDPVSPNKMKLAMISLAMGVGLAGGVPFLLNLTNTTIARIPDLEASTGLTGIGIVPMADPEFLEEIVRSPMIGAEVPNALLENFRVIRSNICLHPNRENKSQVVMVTSARPSEGKSTQAANLAWAFYSMGERTLLIDCDLRRGRQHGLTGVENSPGMTALLTGSASLEEVIKKTENPNLDVIPRGPVIPGSTEVLCQSFFDDIVKALRGHYQRIVLDTPPVLGLSETASLQRLTDGVVLVVRAEATTRRDVTDAISHLVKSGAHLFGFVLNGIDLRKASNYYNYYYYSAAYYDSFDDGDGGGSVKGGKEGSKVVPQSLEERALITKSATVGESPT